MSCQPFRSFSGPGPRFRLLLAGAALVLWSMVLTALPLDQLELPPGFTVTVFTDDVPNARQLALSPAGTLFVGSKREGAVYAVVDSDADFRADRVLTLARDLYMPSGVAFRDGSLYVAEVNRILRFDGIEARLDDPPTPVVVFDQLPSKSHHGWKFIAFGPDDRLYVPVGAPCNVCAVEPPFGTILRATTAGDALEVYASGIRNSVGFDWHPVTGALWFTDNGRDRMGDDLPPCELNRALKPGLHFGFPHIHGGDISDPEFGRDRSPDEFTPPAYKLDAHVAPLGAEFYTGTQFPERYRNALFVAEHGSWNRTRKAGYRVMVATIAADGTVSSYAPFVTGWLRGQANWGRPVDFEIMPDGSMLIADDHAGAVYRVSYPGN